jgi:hypothetical protein
MDGEIWRDVPENQNAPGFLAFSGENNPFIKGRRNKAIREQTKPSV